MKLLKYQLMTKVKNVYKIPITEEAETTVETVVPKEVDGEIIYVTVTETVIEPVVIGYEEKVDVKQILTPTEIKCSDSNFETNYAIAEKEAYNGEITVEEVEDPATEPTTDDLINAMLGVE